MPQLKAAPHGGDAVRLCARWDWAGDGLPLGSIGHVQGGLDTPHNDYVSIIFKPSSFIGNNYRRGEEYCSSSGGPGTIATPISELKPTSDRVAIRCWRWKDGEPRANNGEDYERVADLWDWYPSNTNRKDEDHADRAAV